MEREGGGGGAGGRRWRSGRAERTERECGKDEEGVWKGRRGGVDMEKSGLEKKKGWESLESQILCVFLQVNHQKGKDLYGRAKTKT